MQLSHITRPSARLYLLILLIGLFLGISLALPAPVSAQDGTTDTAAPDIGATLLAVGFMSFVANRITEGIAAPLRQRYPGLDTWWLIYVSWVLGGVLVFLAGLNLFAEYFPNMVIGQLLTAVVVGGGGNILDGVESWLRGSRGTAVIELSAETPAPSIQPYPDSITPLTSHKAEQGTRRTQ